MPTKMRLFVVSALPMVCCPASSITTMSVKVPPVSTEILNPILILCPDLVLGPRPGDARFVPVLLYVITRSRGAAPATRQARELGLGRRDEIVELGRRHRRRQKAIALGADQIASPEQAALEGVEIGVLRRCRPGAAIVAHRTVMRVDLEDRAKAGDLAGIAAVA